MPLTLTFVRLMHVVNGKEKMGLFCFPVMSEDVTFTEQQLLKNFKIKRL